jgi:hypothetical protein
MYDKYAEIPLYNRKNTLKVYTKHPQKTQGESTRPAFMKKSANVTPEAHIVGQTHDSAGVMKEASTPPKNTR